MKIFKSSVKNANLVFASSLLTLSLAKPAAAVCPVCIVAVGAGLGLSQYLGIDDSIAGVWIGGLTAAIAAWTINWFNKKNWQFGNRTWRDLLTVILYYALVAWPLFTQNLIGHPGNRLFNIDKLVLGIIIGSLAFTGASLWYSNLKKNNGGHAHFPFQKVVMPFGALVILSGLFYLLTK